MLYMFAKHSTRKIVPRESPRQRLQIQSYTSVTSYSNALFQSRHWVSLDNFLCRFGFYHDDLAENLLLAGFCGWLRAHFESSQAWKGKEASLLHLLLGKTRQSADHVGCNFPFQLMLACQRIDQISLRHGFHTRLGGGLHGNRQHCTTELWDTETRKKQQNSLSPH